MKKFKLTAILYFITAIVATVFYLYYAVDAYIKDRKMWADGWRIRNKDGIPVLVNVKTKEKASIRSMRKVEDWIET